MIPFGAAKEIAQAVAIAALSAVATKFIEWGVDELKERQKRKRGSDGEKEDVASDDAGREQVGCASASDR